MKKLSRLLNLFLVAGLTQSALATTVLYDQSKMFYLPISVGEYLPNSNRDINNSFYGSLGLGYNFTNVFALQAQLGYFSPDYESNNQPFNSYLGTVEARFNAANPTRFVPYFLIGGGVLKLPNAKMVADYGVGLDIKLSPAFSFGGTVKQIYQGSSPSHLDTLLTGNFTWYFGRNNQPVAQPAPVPTSEQQDMLQKAQTTLKPVLPDGVVPCIDNKLGNQDGCVTFEGDTMIMHLNVHFQQNKADIQSKYNTPIASVSDFMSAYPDTHVTLYGYASSEGPKAFNQTLSAQRAESIKDYLVNVAHVDNGRIDTMGMGTQDPIASNATLAGRQMNRRVEAKIPVPYNLDH
jgi:OmpA-OmpF porin, OOP family